MTTQFHLQQPGGIRRDLKILVRYFKLNLMSAIEFKMGIVTLFTNVILNLFVWLIYWSVILDTNGGTFGSWGPSELIVWYFFTEFTIGIFGLFTGFATIYYYVIETGMESLLSKPIHPLLDIFGREMYFVSIFRSIFSIVILIAGILIFNIKLSIYDLFLGGILSVCAIIIFNCLYVIFQTFSFWIGNVEFLVETLVDVEMNFIRLPQQFIPTTILFSVFVVIPVGLFATIPTLLIFNSALFSSLTKIGEFGFMMLIVMFSILVLFVTRSFFAFGLQRYEGVGE